MKAVRIEVDDSVIDLTLGQTPIVNGQQLNVASSAAFHHSFAGGGIVSNQLFIFVFFDIGIELAWDRGNTFS